MSSSLYESPDLLAQYLLMHFGDDAALMPWAFGPKEALHYPRRCIDDLAEVASLGPQARALDLGCAVGGASFHLAGLCGHVLGIDFSPSFVRAAQALLAEGRLAYAYPVVGAQQAEAEARVTVPDGVELDFEVGDAQALRPDLGSFDLVLAANLLCRLPEPRRFLERLPALVRPGGQLILTTPQTWLEAYTPREHWVGAGEEGTSTLEALQALLGATFELKLRRDLPFVIREHSRKFQWSVAEGTRWRRKTQRS